MQLLPDVSTWGVLKCARYLKSEGQRLESTDINELQSKVLETIRERAVEGILADYFELDRSDDSSEWVGGRYVFQDWFDGANRSISVVLADQLADLYGVDPEIGRHSTVERV